VSNSSAHLHEGAGFHTNDHTTLALRFTILGAVSGVLAPSISLHSQAELPWERGYTAIKRRYVYLSEVISVAGK